MKIVIIGSGNIATFFAKKIHSAELSVVQIISNTESHAKELAQQIPCDFSTSVDDIYSDADVVILAVKDDVLRTFSLHKKLQNKLIIHTAGSVSLSDISGISNQVGSIWCMYSINKNYLPDRKDIP